MGFFNDLRGAITSVHSKRQSYQYRRLRRDTQSAKLEREKLRVLRQATKERTRAKKDIKKLKPKRQFHLIGNWREFAKGIPSDSDLNKALFGADNLKRPPKGGK